MDGEPLSLKHDPFTVESRVESEMQRASPC